MELGHKTIEIKCPNISTLLWDGDELVDVTKGLRARLDGGVSRDSYFTGYPFDRALGVRKNGSLYSVLYANRGTKAILMKDGRVMRQLNRDYYFADAYDYPIAMTVDKGGGLL